MRFADTVKTTGFECQGMALTFLSLCVCVYSVPVWKLFSWCNFSREYRVYELRSCGKF